MSSQPIVNTDILTDPEYMRLKGLRDQMDQALVDGAKFGQQTSAEGNAATFYSRKDLQMMRDNYNDQMSRRALEITGGDNPDADFAQSVQIVLPRY